MNPPEIQQYQYLWDGTQPGWVLSRFYGHDLELSLLFESAGPSNRELMAIRRAISEFTPQPLHQIAAELRGKPDYFLGRINGRLARNIITACRKEGLRLSEKVIDTSGYLLINEIKNSCLLIEDDELARQVHESAIQHGLPVRLTES
ncbi:hypothetical protein ACO0LF_26775 [Undibacterium sp. Di27W]|uniref:hypothetical protein n=1 Tax=Undibacterium sp. Di27W TaxID=3413036 RepID=UPI003BEFFF34